MEVVCLDDKKEFAVNFNKKVIYSSLIVAGLMIMSGCAVKYVPKPDTPPKFTYCFASVGHVKGAKPFIQGGTCCCTPTEGILADYKEHGFYPDDFTLDDLITTYKGLGIVTDLDAKNTNNLDINGPHVVFGGKSMITPTPGTQNYEDVLFGKRTKWKIKKRSLRRVLNEKKK